MRQQNCKNSNAGIEVLGVMIKKYRIDRSLTYEQLAEKVGVSTRIIYDYEDVDEDLIFEFLRLFSAIRQYCVHNQQFKLSDNEASKKLYEIADKKIESFEKEFTKINKKNLLVLEDFCSKYSNRYKYEDIQNTYYKYVSFDEGKNIGISVDKLAKLIKEKQANFIVDPNKEAEFKKQI